VDLCETEKTLCNRINVLGTQNLIDAVRAAKSRLIYLSTDYVFDGKSGPYSEKDTPNPMNFYGKCKLKAENLIQKQLDDFIIARTTVVYGWEKQGKNFVMNMIARLKRGERVKVPIDQIGTPTYVNNIAEIFLDLASKKTRGVFNVAGPELMNRYTFAKLAAKIFGLSEELLVPIKTSDLGQKAPRPLNAGMKIAKLRSVSHVQMLSPKEGLSHMRASKRD